ncbi:glycine-rich domain-containing protein [Commensalibacter nepenthis]|uniref:Glycine-rich domain-containing protein n=1 Tax=Commensalibacter nepenthis TaxID=3043872 RepID=A0ABT6Q857_9PROT|nr:hypothetical protein [Commensalibacter sp. TBRC 10068]MDI2113093.1 hypothetical protein [Commensalibacter sp. TBRC 10068]
MAFGYLNNSLLLGGLMQVDDYNEVIRFYGQISAFQYQNYKNVGDLITASDWQDLSNHIQALRNQNYTIPWVPTGFVKGRLIRATSWSNAIYREVSSPGDYTFQAPNESRKIQFEWLMAGGGSGGGGDETGYGASGGGGGSGGYQQNISFSLSGGETITVHIGAGGSPTDKYQTDGGNGSDSYIMINNQEKLRVTGGQGGQNALAVNYSGANPKGGVGGSPNGVAGGDGLRGNNNDKIGGAGGNTPLGVGGQPTWADHGESASGYGAGGGGGCTRDRQRPGYWIGGFGSGGYCLFNLTN